MRMPRTRIGRACLAVLALVCALGWVACGASQPTAAPTYAGGAQKAATPGVAVAAPTGSHEGTSQPPRATSTLVPASPLPTPGDTSGPVFERITTSSKVFAISDCTPTTITVTAHISDPSGVRRVALWYRVGDSRSFTPVDVDDLGGGTYAVTVKGTDMLGLGYGVWAFYLTAEDGVGNKSQSPVDTSVQLLPCVG